MQRFETSAAQHVHDARLTQLPSQLLSSRGRQDFGSEVEDIVHMYLDLRRIQHHLCGFRHIGHDGFGGRRRNDGLNRPVRRRRVVVLHHHQLRAGRIVRPDLATAVAVFDFHVHFIAAAGLQARDVDFGRRLLFRVVYEGLQTHVACHTGIDRFARFWADQTIEHASPIGFPLVAAHFRVDAHRQIAVFVDIKDLLVHFFAPDQVIDIAHKNPQIGIRQHFDFKISIGIELNELFLLRVGRFQHQLQFVAAGLHLVIPRVVRIVRGEIHRNLRVGQAAEGDNAARAERRYIFCAAVHRREGHFQVAVHLIDIRIAHGEGQQCRIARTRIGREKQFGVAANAQRATGDFVFHSQLAVRHAQFHAVAISDRIPRLEGVGVARHEFAAHRYQQIVALGHIGKVDIAHLQVPRGENTAPQRVVVAERDQLHGAPFGIIHRKTHLTAEAAELTVDRIV